MQQSVVEGDLLREEMQFPFPSPRANSRVIREAFALVLLRQKRTGVMPVLFWRRRRDSNSRYGFPYYSLSRGAP